VPGDLLVLSCTDRLPRVLQMLVQCCGAALPDGGTLRLSARTVGGRAMVEVDGTGPRISLPDARQVGRLTHGDARPADWFALTSFTIGIGGELGLTGDASRCSVTLRLPLPGSTLTQQVPSC
jgi:hypothetical protein